MHDRYDVIVIALDAETGELVERDYADVARPVLSKAEFGKGETSSQYGFASWNSVTAQKLSGVRDVLSAAAGVAAALHVRGAERRARVGCEACWHARGRRPTSAR